MLTDREPACEPPDEGRPELLKNDFTPPENEEFPEREEPAWEPLACEELTEREDPTPELKK